MDPPHRDDIALVGIGGELMAFHAARQNLFQCRFQAADRFLAAYTERAGARFDYDPRWDIEMLLDVLPDPKEYPPWRHWGLSVPGLTERRRRADELLERALARL